MIQNNDSKMFLHNKKPHNKKILENAGMIFIKFISLNSDYL